MTIENIIV